MTEDTSLSPEKILEEINMKLDDGISIEEITTMCEAATKKYPNNMIYSRSDLLSMSCQQIVMKCEGF